MKRTHNCGELTGKNTGKEAILNGWVSNRRDHGGLIFIDLRDRYGITQITFNPKVSKEIHAKAEKLRSEFVVAVKGNVSKRPKGTHNKKIPTGEIEIVAKELEIISESETPPLEVDEHINANEDSRLKWRYLDLRRGPMQKNIILRHKMVKAVRDYYDSRGFLEIETPILAKSTPEGARDYLVPSRVNPGKFFALPQSPQIFKQLLMVSGFDKYMQIIKCFRDEDLRADRQPEFTQIDVEMSFVDEEDIYEIHEGLMKYVLDKVFKIKLKTPFPRMNWQEAMDRYGVDKPDTRFGMEIFDVSDEAKESEFNVFKGIIAKGGKVRGISVPKGIEFSKKELEELTEFVKVYKAKGLAWMKVGKGGKVDSPIAKFFSEKLIKEILKKMDVKENDLLLFVADDWRIVCDSLGNLRNHLAKKLKIIDPKKFNFLWVVDFPMFEMDEEDQRPKAMHHPFTSPRKEDLDLLEKEPLKVRSVAYDLTLNGVELGGGSIRIHKKDLQKRVFKAMGISDEEAENKFGFMMNAFRYGAPPHGGIAFGMDRFVMVMVGADSIRDVIAFPKNKAAISLMDESPSEVSEEQLKELRIKLDIEKPNKE